MQVAPRVEVQEITRNRVLSGLAQLLEAEVPFSFRELAKASSVPERTLYRYFPSKEALFEAFWEDLNARFSLPDPPRSLDGLLERATLAFAQFDAHAPLVRAMLHDPNGKQVRVGNAPKRRREFENALAEELDLDSMPRTERTRVLACVQLLVSAAGWESMKDYWGLDGSAAADAVRWAIQALVAQAKRDAKRTKTKQRKKN
jgi:AcrR family transcriptional regulator